MNINQYLKDVLVNNLKSIYLFLLFSSLTHQLYLELLTIVVEFRFGIHLISFLKINLEFDGYRRFICIVIGLEVCVIVFLFIFSLILFVNVGKSLRLRCLLIICGRSIWSWWTIILFGVIGCTGASLGEGHAIWGVEGLLCWESLSNDLWFMWVSIGLPLILD